MLDKCSYTDAVNEIVEVIRDDETCSYTDDVNEIVEVIRVGKRVLFHATFNENSIYFPHNLLKCILCCC